MNTFPLHKTTQLYCRFMNLLDKVYSPPFNLHPEKIWVNFMGYILQGTFYRAPFKFFTGCRLNGEITTAWVILRRRRQKYLVEMA
jgi:hypothetical protein